ncbi:MAG TPA: hypothetical protein PK079_11095 [Leptospiraceae bacterium]|nr:hypothetical protein [Leptospiraceae bacterium]HMW07417.1 hypothetical protein [Leptospiraceae bacterium]HMX34689.1 hypothetical protein [Leptospiraceae bacterium]HMY32996.1 hypothetical protein [Leptospiraceae bacterium]HMZ63546.1 hypothetical protein [Leptospiraceae bacterium]
MEQVRKITETILEERNLNKFFAFASTVIKEFLQNGAKATQKRIFFKNHGLDIDKNHKQGIEKFKESMSNGDIHNHQLIDGIDFLVELRLQELDKGVLISVRNHGEMNENEIKNVNFMIDRGRRTNEVSDLLSDETSNKEGGGLGLSMIVILMKKLGLTPDCLYYEVKNSFTSFNVKIPYNI